MKTQKILAIIALSILGLGLILYIVTRLVKSSSIKIKLTHTSSFLVIIAAVLLAISQFIHSSKTQEPMDSQDEYGDNNTYWPFLSDNCYNNQKGSGNIHVTPGQPCSNSGEDCVARHSTEWDSLRQGSDFCMTAANSDKLDNNSMRIPPPPFTLICQTTKGSKTVTTSSTEKLSEQLMIFGGNEIQTSTRVLKINDKTTFSMDKSALADNSSAELTFGFLQLVPEVSAYAAICRPDGLDIWKDIMEGTNIIHPTLCLDGAANQGKGDCQTTKDISQYKCDKENKNWNLGNMFPTTWGGYKTAEPDSSPAKPWSPPN